VATKTGDLGKIKAEFVLEPVNGISGAASEDTN
jgi:hypothetical protein